MNKYKEGYEQGKFDKEMEMLYEKPPLTKLKCKMPYIDYLIVMLGMANIAVRINNHNLGVMCNCKCRIEKSKTRLKKLQPYVLYG